MFKIYPTSHNSIHNQKQLGNKWIPFMERPRPSEDAPKYYLHHRKGHFFRRRWQEKELFICWSRGGLSSWSRGVCQVGCPVSLRLQLAPIVCHSLRCFFSSLNARIILATSLLSVARLGGPNAGLLSREALLVKRCRWIGLGRRQVLPHGKQEASEKWSGSPVKSQTNTVARFLGADKLLNSAPPN